MSFRRVLAYCQSRVFQLADAEELAQESLIRAMVDLPALSEPTAYGAWLRGIANHVCSDWHRRQRRAPQNELMDQTASLEADPADQAAIDPGLRHRAMQIIADLAPASARSDLQSLAKDSDSIVSQFATAALARLSKQSLLRK